MMDPNPRYDQKQAGRGIKKCFNSDFKKSPSNKRAGEGKRTVHRRHVDQNNRQTQTNTRK